MDPSDAEWLALTDKCEISTSRGVSRESISPWCAIEANGLVLEGTDGPQVISPRSGCSFSSLPGYGKTMSSSGRLSDFALYGSFGKSMSFSVDRGLRSGEMRREEK